MDDHARTLARWPHHRLFDGDTWIADREHDAVPLEMRPERRACLRLLESEKRRPGLDQGDLATEARERLAEFDADGASAEDRQRHRQFLRNRPLTVGPEIDAVGTRDGRDGCGAAVGDDHGAAREELLVANTHRALIDQFPFAY